MRPLRIVLVMIEPPLPFGNAAARWFYVLLRELVARGHHVTALATCHAAADEGEALRWFPRPEYDLRCFPEPDRRGLWRKWETLLRPYSFMFSRPFNRAFQQELAKGFDILHLEQLWSGWMGVGHADRSLVNVHHLTSIDLARAPSGGCGSWIRHRQMFLAERMLIRRFRYFRSSTPRVTPILQRLNPRAIARTVPLGLDMNLYPFVPAERRTGEPVVTLIGSMHWYPGYSAATRLLTRLWPEIKARIPRARLQIVGWNARKLLAPFLHWPDVGVHQDVADTRPYFENAGVFLYAPERGSGMKVKILEAMAYGVPVVTTHEGVEGLPARDGRHAGVSDSDAGLVARTVRLLQDPVAQQRQRLAARQMVEEHCSPLRALDGIEAMYAHMLDEAGRGRHPILAGRRASVRAGGTRW